MKKQRADLTFKYNQHRGRHGWVRLTPAYSVKIVQQVLDKKPEFEFVLEPFSGTGTTGLVAGQLGLDCDLLDINPFLIWLAEVKCANYNNAQVTRAKAFSEQIILQARKKSGESEELWTPPISNIERWWHEPRLNTLARIYQSLNNLVPKVCHEKNLLLVAFCRLVMKWSNAAYNHQSISFKHNVQQSLFDEDEEIYQSFLTDFDGILAAASDPVPGNVKACLRDSRYIERSIGKLYDIVITSPPYPNRMSYIRELRPHMFWLGYLRKGSDAGALDWDAIGGTWGVATSKLLNWIPDDEHGNIPRLRPLIERVSFSSIVLSRYIHRYFSDMSRHFCSLYDAVAPGGKLFYIIGNSKFFDTLIPAEKLYADLMVVHGFENVNIKTIRKRNSKKELFEYLVTAHKPFPTQTFASC